MRIGLIALDERPVNTRYPRMVADIAGVELVQPPMDMLNHLREPADCDALADWLRERSDTLDGLVVALAMLGYGGLIPSRITSELAVTVLNRLELLRSLKRQHPSLSIYGFDLIMRISNADSNTEEPLYWSEYGTRFYRYSQLLDRQLQGEEVDDELADLVAQLPAEHKDDFLSRRLRNHIVNLGALELAGEEVFDLLVISSDDTSPYGLGTREKRWVTEWVDRVLDDSPTVLMYPGADEVGCALLARAINVQNGVVPRFALRYAIPGDDEVTAPFEDGPVRITLERQVRAVGGQIVADVDDANIIVAVNPPSRRHPMGHPEYNEAEIEHRTPYMQAFSQQIQAWLEEGRQVIVTDVAYPNGSDPALIGPLLANVDLTRLVAYGAWNTAGNTIGVALAQGIAAGSVEGDPQRAQAQRRFLAHRFLEDWGYQFAVRTEVGQAYRAKYGRYDIAPEHLDMVKAEIEARLRVKLAELPGFAGDWRVKSGSIRLPWNRFFEVDFDLEPVD